MKGEIFRASPEKSSFWRPCCYSKIKIDLARISYIVKKMIFIAVSILTGGSFIEVFITRAFLTDFLVEK